MIKVCAACHSTWAGGSHCEDCGGALADPFGDDAKSLPPSMWRYIRLQYGARRGMIVRVIAVLFGPIVAALLLRASAGAARPWSIVLASAALPAGVATWAAIHWLAGRAVRIWVLRRGQLSKRRLARALARRALGR